MKAGMAVYLHQSPMLRGNISRVTKDGIFVTWHKYVTDVPESLKGDMKVNLREASVRMRVFYRKSELKHIGLGVPTA